MTAADNSKSALRQQILAKRNALSETQRRDYSRRITATILSSDAYRNSGNVLAYQSFGSEFITDDFIARVFADGKKLALPKINRQERRLELYLVENPDEQLSAGVWGILEPQPQKCEAANPMQIDFVLTPGLAFTRAGDRLGYGGGFYDRLMATLNPRAPRVAATFSLQICDSVPTAAHDEPVDLVITEESAFHARRRPDA
ncbi:MAG: 5-formyltetrahydrofolate cyclo-ligase [Pseudomonadota bacterium]|nr:5-formyltetrahydrofolate cyclo-ligase [Burkholderiales bacterium]MDQ3196922.1 5-formyltetrahydrofolate cyclo-ligase [Pseudomonadota bacterium]